MGYNTTTDRLLDRLTKALNSVELNTDNLELQTGGKYDSSGRTLTTGDITPVALNVSGETIVALSAVDNAVLDDIKAAVEIIDNAISGTEMQVDVVSIVPGTGATNLGKAEDAAHTSGDVGVMPLAVRNDALATLGGADGDYAPLQVDAFGALYTQNVFGSFGNIFVNDQDAITCGVADRVFVAIYMLTNTVFTLLIAETEQLYLDDTGTSTSVDGDGGTATGSTVFPAGMTLYGRYDGFTLASGSVIAYVG